MLKLKLQYFDHLMQRADSFDKTLMLGMTEGRRRRGDRGWDGWMASPTQWTWVWVNSGSWWWTGRPCVLWFTGSERVLHNWATELTWTDAHYFVTGKAEVTSHGNQGSVVEYRWKPMGISLELQNKRLSVAFEWPSMPTRNRASKTTLSVTLEKTTAPRYCNRSQARWTQSVSMAWHCGHHLSGCSHRSGWQLLQSQSCGAEWWRPFHHLWKRRFINCLNSPIT